MTTTARRERSKDFLKNLNKLNCSEKWRHRRSILKNGKVIDPFNQIITDADLSIVNGKVESVQDEISSTKGDVLIDVSGCLVCPGLLDIHLHLHDLFEVTTQPIVEAVTHGVTSAITPGAGNTLMAPSLLGAEVDRGLPLNAGCLIGAAAILAPKATIEEKIKFLKGEMEAHEAGQVISKNPITNNTAHLTIGIKEHSGHYRLSDDHINELFELSSAANLLLMSHTQWTESTERIVDLSQGRPVHLGHATAVGAESSHDPITNLEQVITLMNENSNVSAEFVTSHLRPSRGNKDGILINAQAQELAFEALKKKYVKILVSDGQSDAVMKGFGDSKDNVPAILELVEKDILSLSDAISLMTLNPAMLLSKITLNDWWVRELGCLSPESRADITIINPFKKDAYLTIVNGYVVSFEGRLIRNSYGAGGFITRKGMMDHTGVGYSNIFSYR